MRGKQKAALQCSTFSEKPWELQIKQTADFCSISIFSISVLSICRGGETKRPSEPHQILLLLPLLWEVNHTPYDESCRPKRSHLPTSPKNVNFSNITLPYCYHLTEFRLPSPTTKGKNICL